jgi:DNA polymerase III delta prime subunit
VRDKKEKYQIIEDISSIVEFSKLIENLLEKAGLSNVIRNSDTTIFATQPGVIDSKYCYIPSVNSLEGKNNEVFDIIKNLESDETIDAFCIVTNKDVSSNKEISDYFRKVVQKRFPSARITFWGKTELVLKIDNTYPGFWQHSDTFLRPYEDFYLDTIETDSELRNLLKLDDKYHKMLNIFIEPRLSVFVEDKEGNRPRPKKIDKAKLVKGGIYVISGDAGTGKTTLLKEIGKELIEQNLHIDDKKNLPVFIKHTDLVSNNFSLPDTIEYILLKIYKNFDLNKIFSDYNIVLLIDSLDELEKKDQKDILLALEKYHNDLNIRFIIGTRSYEYLLKDCEIQEPLHITIENFNLKQIEAFLQNFFKFDILKANDLLYSLHDNRILDKLPITPLTLSVISILYEERQYEIPATITDIYDNFHLFLLGRTSVQSSLEFLDINVKERILSIYALEILLSSTREPKNLSDFVLFIEEFFSKRRITIVKKQIPELVQSLIQGTGVLYIDDNNMVNFKHNFFMEYYASREIFNHQRRLEAELINRFTDFNWQNTAIFYAGRTKDMPEFLTDIINKIQEYDNIVDCLVSMSGMGYLLQALWLTDANIRKDGIKEALNANLKALEQMKKVAAEKGNFFSGVQYPTLALVNTIFFFKDFNSVTLKDPLILAFDELYQQYIQAKNNNDRHKTTILFQLFNISLALYSDRINVKDRLLDIMTDEIVNEPIILMLFDKSMDIIDGFHKAKKIKDEINFNKYVRKHIASLNYYVETPAEQLRLTSFDNIGAIKDIEIYTEGKTDPLIIERAYEILTDGSIPYWSIRSCGNSGLGSGAAELRKLLESIEATFQDVNSQKKIIIGIFDNDMKGNQEFGGLKKNLFDFWRDSKRIKKHKEYNIYAIKLPIPISKEVYLKDKQEFMFFSIENYFPNEFLKEKDVAEEVIDFPGIYTIKDKKKLVFAEMIRSETKLELFEDFKFLFNEIDLISQKQTPYIP